MAAESVPHIDRVAENACIAALVAVQLDEYGRLRLNSFDDMVSTVVKIATGWKTDPKKDEMEQFADMVQFATQRLLAEYGESS